MLLIINYLKKSVSTEWIKLFANISIQFNCFTKFEYEKFIDFEHMNVSKAEMLMAT